MMEAEIKIIEIGSKRIYLIFTAILKKRGE